MSSYEFPTPQQPEYSFADRTERTEVSYEDVSTYDDDPSLGRGVGVSIVVKVANQTEHDAHMRNLLAGGYDLARGLTYAPTDPSRARYFDGLVARSTLEDDYVSPENCDITTMLQPTGFDRQADGTEVFASANTLTVVKGVGSEAVSRVIEGDWFARLHSAEFNPDGSRILTASSAFDVLYEIDTATGRPVWSMDVWAETPLRTNENEQTFYRELSQLPPDVADGFLHNPDRTFLRDDEAALGAHCVIDDPSQYEGLGLATSLMPAFINSLSYGRNGELLATSYPRGDAWVIDREERHVDIIADGMGRPHGLHADPLLDGYIVTDTTGEKVSFVSGDLERERVLDFSTLDGMKPGLESAPWLQYTTMIAEGLYCAAITSRQKLILFDPVNRTKREIALDPDWGVQLVAGDMMTPDRRYSND